MSSENKTTVFVCNRGAQAATAKVMLELKPSTLAYFKELSVDTKMYTPKQYMESVLNDFAEVNDDPRDAEENG